MERGCKAESEARVSRDARELYLRLLATALSGGLQDHVLRPVTPSRGPKRRLFEPVRRLLETRGLVLARGISTPTTRSLKARRPGSRAPRR